MQKAVRREILPDRFYLLQMNLAFQNPLTSG